jgi:probable rRNA maturation factor
MITIEVSPSKPTPDPALVEQAVRAALAHQAASQGGLTVLLTDDAQVRSLNHAYLGLDEPTDVLAFPAAETDPETGISYLGDVVISVPRAAEQAASGGHALEAELQLLAVHGVLHLLGHDHAEAEQKDRMWAAQAEILAGLGLADIINPD